MARDIGKIIDFLIAEVIPADQTFCIKDMRSVYRKAAYSSPEQSYERWHELGHVLCMNLGEENNDWKKRVGRIMRDEEKVPGAELPQRKED